MSKFTDTCMHYLASFCQPLLCQSWLYTCLFIINIGPADALVSDLQHTKCGFFSVINHHGDVIMGTIASQITSFTIVYSTVYSGADQRKHQSSASLAFVRGIHRRPVNIQMPVTRKMFPFDVIMHMIFFNDNHIPMYILNYFRWISVELAPEVQIGDSCRINIKQTQPLWKSWNTLIYIGHGKNERFCVGVLFWYSSSSTNQSCGRN